MQSSFRRKRISRNTDEVNQSNEINDLIKQISNFLEDSEPSLAGSFKDLSMRIEQDTENSFC